jgi:hypothetical protein
MRRLLVLGSFSALGLGLLVGVAGAGSAPNTLLHYSITHKSTQYFHIQNVGAASTAKCKLDKRAWYKCGLGGETLRNLKKGQHTFRAKAISPSGKADPTPAVKTWKVTKR